MTAQCRIATVTALISAFLGAASNNAWALGGDDLIVTLGVKGWLTEWDSWFRSNAFFRTGAIQISEPVDSSTQAVAIPSISVRYSNFLLSGSYLLRQTYDLSGSQDSLSASRNEFDVNLGYYVLPGLALTAGYKQISQDYGGGAFRWRGPTVAVLPAASLSPHWAVYGVASYGLFHLDVPEIDADAANETSFSATYALAEAGLSYAIDVPHVIKAVRLTVGYRAQILTTKGYKLSSLSATGAAITPDPYEHDVTYGPTVGLSGSF